MSQIDLAQDLETVAAQLRGKYGHLDGGELLSALAKGEMQGKIMITSSFGAESVVLLDLVAKADPSIPVVFLDTRRLFGETLRYQRQITELLGLEDVRIIRPDSADLENFDPDDMLFTTDSDKCCHIRKVLPLDKSLKVLEDSGFKGWITGRKRFQASSRSSIEVIEASDGFIKINPLANWSEADIKAAFMEKNLPPHPLVADGFLSIGCMPCTERVVAGGDARSGRWSGKGKTECGIHMSRPSNISSIN
ncbi:phosphoadenylyl-sulfate reductase [Sneathiella sp. P13V-1]|uniref:phosphoadenylyl-sulfate reductase n=1 Tax=Sneathiella sp. P13V-1 TaxID=2697366 RepID=UPI00187BB987|nr:phosphoadenylyl-sulfate reductase [Sneathiella sp. P13V-1]MBE7636542.1 phosphoadenylyl-sulfate reductase [Sneathiella sp. P13V-1]